MNTPDPLSSPSRRAALGAVGAAVATTAVGASSLGLAGASTRTTSGTTRLGGVLTAEELGWNAAAGRYDLPALPYAYDALEPAIDAQTMEIHHSKHHAGYVRGLGRALDALAAIRAGTGDASLIKHWSRELSFHGSGHVNHSLFWRTMAPPGSGGGGLPSGDLAARIDRDFDGFAGFRTHFAAASRAVEGSGWGWLVYEPAADRLLVLQGEKQQNLMMTGVVPLLGLDVWEHAYYLRYQNRRADYVEAFFEVIDWRFVAELLGRVTDRS